jgi:hypothetical protein
MRIILIFFFVLDLTCEARRVPPVMAKGVDKPVLQNLVIKDDKADEAAIKSFYQIYMEQAARMNPVAWA